MTLFQNECIYYHNKFLNYLSNYLSNRFVIQEIIFYEIIAKHLYR